MDQNLDLRWELYRGVKMVTERLVRAVEIGRKNGYGVKYTGSGGALLLIAREAASDN